MILVRYADDIIVGFQHEADARRFLDAMRERFGKFALSLHPDKTRVLEFGRFAAANRQRRGVDKPETFDFLGFTFICGKSRAGRFLIHRKSRPDRMRAKLKEIKKTLRQRMHESIPAQANGWDKSCAATSTITPCRPTAPPLQPSDTTSWIYGGARSGDAVRKTTRPGSGCCAWSTTGFPSRPSFIPGPASASPSDTRGGSRMRESRTYGSVRGARSNARPYRDSLGDEGSRAQRDVLSAPSRRAISATFSQRRAAPHPRANA
jgi:hypothetical protein